MKLLTAFAAVPFLLALSASAQAACIYPQAPTSIPNGNTATKEEMLAAQAQIKEYTRLVQGPAAPPPGGSAEDMAKFQSDQASSYIACLEKEKAEAIAALDPADPEFAKKKEVAELMQAKKHNAAIDELDALAARWRGELAAFKAKAAK
jgi:hypothetical protein